MKTPSKANENPEQAPMSPVNHVPLTPMSLLERTARVFPGKIATVYNGRRQTFANFQQRVFRMTHALEAAGVGAEGKVAVLAPNVPMMLEAHFGIPWRGRVIVAINTKKEAPIFNVATYGCVADLFVMAPLLVEEFKKVLAK